MAAPPNSLVIASAERSTSELAEEPLKATPASCSGKCAGSISRDFYMLPVSSGHISSSNSEGKLHGFSSIH